MDFATAVVPGWHTTIFPPYFVAGAIFSGMAMVLTLMLVARKTMRLEDYITPRHIDAMCNLVILTSGMVGLAYGPSSSSRSTRATRTSSSRSSTARSDRWPGATGSWWRATCCIPQLFWFTRRAPQRSSSSSSSRSSINVGMWFERFIIIVASLQRDFLPSALVGLHADVD